MFFSISLKSWNRPIRITSDKRYGARECNDLKLIERYGHGGDLWSAAAVYGGSAETYLDYSANINPLGPPKLVLHALNQARDSVTRYPDPGHRRLKQLLAARLQVEEACLLIGNGAAECMALLLLAEQPQRVGVVAPCFSEYEGLSHQFGAEVLTLIGSAEQDYQATAEELEQFIPQVDICFLGYPNNPTGVMYDCKVLVRAIEAAERSNTVLAVDEAFIDFIDDGESRSVLHMLKKQSNIVVFRSLTKFYAIPGLRLGYAVSHPDRIAAMIRKQVTWSVNGLALAAGEAMFGKEEGAEELLLEYEAATRELIKQERRWMEEQLTEIGMQVWPSEVNFLLCAAPFPWTAASLQAALGQERVLIRSCSMYAGLSEPHYRLAVKDHASNVRLIEAMRHVISGKREG